MDLHRRELTKPDGRRLWLYGRAPIDPAVEAVVPEGTAVLPNPHLRYHPLRGEWVAYAGHRQTRTFLPPAGYNPLAPTRPGEAPTELPSGDYDVAVFENRFPTFFSGANGPPVECVPTKPARGACEVVVFTQDPKGSLGALPEWHIELLLRVWADRTVELGRREDVAYVMPFENRGVEVGATLHHPHGQIYAYPFVPPVAERELQQQKQYYDEHGAGLLQALLDDEVTDGRRIIVAKPRALAVVPVCARYAYEVWVAPRRGAPRLSDLDDEDLRDFASVLKTTLRKLDALFSRPMPYVMVFHQAPTDGALHPEAHVHLEIYPALRMPDRLKFLAGSELGAGVFTADTFPEEKAAELRAVVIDS